ncbi:MAG TPA: hypothetical protein VHN74_00365 [Candidatus Angelobacter sp.]|nr:hypothetical protein [Candidatus Angelobacter sp.]
MTNQGPSSLPGGSAAITLDARHDDKRLHIAIPVKVFPDVKSFESQLCCTYEISPRGARIALLPGIKEVGQTIYVQRQSRRARYRVAWIGEAGTSREGQVGVETLEPANVIWESEIRSWIMTSK